MAALALFTGMNDDMAACGSSGTAAANGIADLLCEEGLDHLAEALAAATLCTHSLESILSNDGRVALLQTLKDAG